MTYTLFRKQNDIEAWLEHYHIQNYTLIPNKEYGYVVDVEGDVCLSYNELEQLKVKFNNVAGDFVADKNKLSSLLGAPQVVKGDFHCSHNELASLKYSPISVGGSFYCSDNNLISLEGCPTTIKEDFNCAANKLKTLQFGPQSLGGYFNCSENELTSLQGGPISVGGNYLCRSNQLISLEFCPEKLGVGFYCFYNPLLGPVQHITDFPEILKVHKETLVQLEKQKLEQMVSGISIVSKSSFKL